MAMALSTPIPAPQGGRSPRHTSPISFFGLSVFRLFILMLLVATVPCASADGNILTGCATSYDPAKDYFPEKITVSEADDFSITYFNNYKLVRNIRTKEQFALYQCGTPAPTSLEAGTKVFPVPLKTIALTQTVEMAFLELLGLRTRVKYVGDPEYFSSTCLQKMVLAGAVSSLSNNATIRAAQYADVDGVFVFSADPTNNRTISSSITQDPGALHRAEWLGFIAAFFNAEATASNLFGNITSRFNCVSSLAKTSTLTPKVAWVSYSASYGPAYPEAFVVSNAAYKQDFTKALGAIPVAPAVTSYNNSAAWRDAVADADFIIDETYLGDINAFYKNFGLNSTSNFKFIKSGQVWRFDKLQNDLGALDWYEGAIPSPDAVLQDLLTIIKPTVTFPHKRVWFRNSFINEAAVIESAKSCPDFTAPKVSFADACSPADDGASSDSVAVTPASLLVVTLASFVALLAAPRTQL